MLKALKHIAFVAAFAAPAASFGQGWVSFGFIPGDLITEAGFNDLAEKDQRRLGFYAEKTVAEVVAVVTANGVGDAETARKHGIVLKKTASRFLAAANKSGLTGPEADELFRRHLIDGFSGQLPAFMVTDTGIAGIADLIALDVGADPSGDADYVGSIRNAGETNAGN